MPSVRTKRVLPPDVPGPFPSLLCKRMADAILVSIDRSLCVKPPRSLKSILMKNSRACATETIASYTVARDDDNIVPFFEFVFDGDGDGGTGGGVEVGRGGVGQGWRRGQP